MSKEYKNKQYTNKTEENISPYLVSKVQSRLPKGTVSRLQPKMFTNLSAASETAVNTEGGIFDGNLKVLTSFHPETKKLSCNHIDGSDVSEDFKKNALPMLGSMANSQMGREDIEKMQQLPTKIHISHSMKSSKLGNSFLDHKGARENGYYKTAGIKPNLGNYDPKSGSDYDEWLGATMTVELGHIDSTKQIKLEAEDYSNDPTDPVFVKVYNGLLNRAIRFRIKYRDEKKQPLSDVTFSPIEDNNQLGLLTYEPDNKLRKEQYDKSKNK